MNIEDLVTILSADAVPHFDFVLFDACFMQSIEVAYALRNFTDYYIGSPTENTWTGGYAMMYLFLRCFRTVKWR